MTKTVKLGRKIWNPEARLAYVLLLPAIALIVVFMFSPIVEVFSMAFHKTDRLGRMKELVYFSNFVDKFKTVEFWKITGRSFLWTAIGVLTKTIFGLVIALLLNFEFRGRKIARMLFIIPWASSAPISTLLWKWVYHHEFGLLNYSLRSIGILNPPVWLGQPVSAFVACLWVDVWIGIPFMALVFLAGMQAIPKDLYEAAHIDGAKFRESFRYITIPGIKHMILIASLLSSLWTFNDFIVIYILTRGGPAGTTDILISSVYKTAFEWGNFDQAAVMSVVTFFILSAISIVYARVYFKGESS
jgi:multiple sugar transport system permease protein